MTGDKLVLALDTSNYTTSAAIMRTDGRLVANLKRPLRVKCGERGLRQSDAVFAHTVNMPELMEEVRNYISGREIAAVGVSDKPRNASGSYMPCFLVGVSCAESIGASLGVPVFRFSHQCGHIMAALYSSGNTELLQREFAAFHVSGGTTELVRVTPSESGFETELLGGSSDLNAGQIIDRIGVYMGLPFPAGSALEQLAVKNTEKIPSRKISACNMNVNLSGLENIAKRLYDESGNARLTAALVFDFIGRSIIAMSTAYEERFGKTKFVYAGGVMCNSIIKEMLSSRFDACFAEPEMSADNAVGIAALTLEKYRTEKFD